MCVCAHQMVAHTQPRNERWAHAHAACDERARSADEDNYDDDAYIWWWSRISKPRACCVCLCVCEQAQSVVVV